MKLKDNFMLTEFKRLVELQKASYDYFGRNVNRKKQPYKKELLEQIREEDTERRFGNSINRLSMPDLFQLLRLLRERKNLK